ncbi:unnamed protein product [Soboliphyme baturini]|uniref:Galectin n=1 Tax=Soboliphyme baturini TaxID=241478 RepID=A0A183ICJ7_9BILA|nr:unnamed protein product [Soboliphyme baturini]
MPYVAKLDKTIEPGQSLIIKGQFLFDGKLIHFSFSVNLCTGPSEEEDIVLHINYRIKDKAIVCNSLKDGVWLPKEVRFKISNKVGDKFDLRVRCHDDKYQIFSDHKDLGEFKHRLAVSSVKYLRIKGTCDLKAVLWEGNYYSCPYRMRLDGMSPGRKLFVSGVAHGKRFAVNFCHNDDVVFHFNPRFDEKAFVRNIRMNGEWQQEERSGKFTLEKKKEFDLLFVCEADAFRVFADELMVCSFVHRFPPSNINAIEIDGELDLQLVHFE